MNAHSTLFSVNDQNLELHIFLQFELISLKLFIYIYVCVVESKNLV